jgi:predicted NAD-dependent protein-ADP-ribosyltransferase YbiA (DUF1768 family)
MHVYEMIREYYPEYTNIERYPAAETVCVRGTHDEWGVLGNFAITPMVVNGVAYDCTERLFHIMKFKPESAEGIKEMMGVPSGLKIKMRFKRIYKEHPEWFHNHWPSMVVDAMRFCLAQKYEQSEAFRKELERSKGKYIVEDETLRKKGRDADSWGVVLKGGEYVGPNLLGRLLMELRDKGALVYSISQKGI